jgi:hypothetical protein
MCQFSCHFDSDLITFYQLNNNTMFTSCSNRILYLGFVSFLLMAQACGARLPFLPLNPTSTLQVDTLADSHQIPVFAIPLSYVKHRDTLQILVPLTPFSLDSTCLREQFLASPKRLKRLPGELLIGKDTVISYLIETPDFVDSLMRKSSFHIKRRPERIQMRFSDSLGNVLESEWFIVPKSGLDRSLSARGRQLAELTLQENPREVVVQLFVPFANPLFDETVLYDPYDPEDIPIHYSTQLPSVSVVSVWIDEAYTVLSRITYLPLFLDDALLVQHTKIVLPPEEIVGNPIEIYASLDESHPFIRYLRQVLREMEWLHYSNRTYLRWQFGRKPQRPFNY